jgi:hypothetical protein
LVGSICLSDWLPSARLPLFEETAWRLEKGFLDPKAARVGFELDGNARGEVGANRLERLYFISFCGMAVEEGASGRANGSGFAGFVGRSQDIEARCKRAKAHGLAEASNVSKLNSVEDH